MGCYIDVTFLYDNCNSLRFWNLLSILIPRNIDHVFKPNTIHTQFAVQKILREEFR